MTAAWLTIPEVSKLLHVSDRTTKRLIARGDLESVVILGRSRRIHPDAVNAYLAQRRATTSPATTADEPADLLRRSARSPHRRGQSSAA